MKLAFRHILCASLFLLVVPTFYPAYATMTFMPFSVVIAHFFLKGLGIFYLFSLLFKKYAHKIKHGNIIINAIFAALPAIWISFGFYLAFGYLYLGFILIFLPLCLFDELAQFGKKGVVFIILIWFVFIYASGNDAIIDFIRNYTELPSLLKAP